MLLLYVNLKGDKLGQIYLHNTREGLKDRDGSLFLLSSNFLSPSLCIRRQYLRYFDYIM